MRLDRYVEIGAKVLEFKLLRADSMRDPRCCLSSDGVEDMEIVGVPGESGHAAYLKVEWQDGSSTVLNLRALESFTLA